MRTHLVIPDQHAHPDHDNSRADLLSKLIMDLKPDVVVNLGDAADMASLCSYDKGKGSFHGRNYQKDIESHLDFQERMWEKVRRSKKRMPYRVILEGNHETRIKKAIDAEPQLEGEKYGISFRDLDLDRWYHEIVEYEGSTPGVIRLDGVSYCHFAVSGVSGRALSSEHHAHALTVKRHGSTTVGHSHLYDYHVRTDTSGGVSMGLVAGVFQDYDSSWAGVMNRLWTRGVTICRDVDNGRYDPEFISLDRLRRVYGS